MAKTHHSQFDFAKGISKPQYQLLPVSDG